MRIALATPALWSNVYCPVGSGQRAIRTLEVLAARSGAAPLSVCVSVDNLRHWFPDPVILYAVGLHLSRHAHRFRVLRLSTYSASLTKMHEHQPTFPILEEIHFNPEEYDTSPWTQKKTLTLFVDAPRLHVLRFARHIEGLVLSWANITTLHGTKSSMDEFLKALRLMPNIRVCSFEQLQRAAHMDTPDDPEVVLHKNMCHVHLDEFYQDLEQGSLLDWCIFPSLETLTLDNVVHLQLSDFLARSTPPLRKLIVGPKPDARTCTTQLTRTLELTSSLTELDLSLCDDSTTQEFCKAFSASRSFLPKLERFTQSWWHYDVPLNDEMHSYTRSTLLGPLIELLLETAASRLAVAPAKFKYQLRAVRIVPLEEGTVIFVPRRVQALLEELRQDGVDVQIGTSYEFAVSS
ncbi:F-box domain-containing protein [Mycena chlorophos]|uniref:F-box domain-containing protein n=1 Tax=Mycena chlorophos TaxID=658473 RepID=A0A8H6S8D1_MYCCL|nr:F-box domain-containing protein [Mycena chlorophos]